MYANYFRLAGKVAARRAIVGADVIPWRPARGVYLIIERDAQSPAALIDIAGIAGIWWLAGGPPLAPEFADNSGLTVSYCFLDDDPVATAQRLRPVLERRWSGGGGAPLLAAPFHVVVPFEWGRYLP